MSLNICTWFSVPNEQIEEDDDGVRDQCGHPPDQEHNCDAQQHSEKGQPSTVTLSTVFKNYQAFYIIVVDQKNKSL
jgi:hypothetical protein